MSCGAEVQFPDAPRSPTNQYAPRSPSRISVMSLAKATFFSYCVPSPTEIITFIVRVLRPSSRVHTPPKQHLSVRSGALAASAPRADCVQNDIAYTTVASNTTRKTNHSSGPAAYTARGTWRGGRCAERADGSEEAAPYHGTRPRESFAVRCDWAPWPRGVRRVVYFFVWKHESADTLPAEDLCRSLHIEAGASGGHSSQPAPCCAPLPSST